MSSRDSSVDGDEDKPVSFRTSSFKSGDRYSTVAASNKTSSAPSSPPYSASTSPDTNNSNSNGTNGTNSRRNDDDRYDRGRGDDYQRGGSRQSPNQSSSSSGSYRGNNDRYSGDRRSSYERGGQDKGPDRGSDRGSDKGVGGEYRSGGSYRDNKDRGGYKDQRDRDSNYVYDNRADRGNYHRERDERRERIPAGLPDLDSLQIGDPNRPKLKLAPRSSVNNPTTNSNQNTPVAHTSNKPNPFGDAKPREFNLASKVQQEAKDDKDKH